MTRCAPTAADWSSSVTALLVIASTLWLAVLVVWNFLIQVKWVDRKKWWSSRTHLLVEPADVIIGNSAKSRDAA